MSAHADAHSGSEAAHDHGPGFYIKIWGILLVLLIISIMGPMFGHVWVTLVTAFGIAVVKAVMVAAYFMHLNVEKKYIWYLLLTMLLLMALLFMGVSSDVMKHRGSNWENKASVSWMEQFEANLAEEYREGPDESVGEQHQESMSGHH
jgi:caa(3)-type oxidase subunit IV